GTVAEQRERLEVVGVEHSAVAVAPNDQGQLADAADDVSGSGNESVHEARTGCLHLDGRTVQVQPILHQAGGRGEAHVGRESSEYQQVDGTWIRAGAIDAAAGGLLAEVAGCLVRSRVASLENAGA